MFRAWFVLVIVLMDKWTIFSQVKVVRSSIPQTILRPFVCFLLVTEPRTTLFVKLVLVTFHWYAHLVELPSGKLISDGWRCLELFSNLLHKTINLCTSGYDRKWSVHYVRHGTGFHHWADRWKLKVSVSKQVLIVSTR